MTGDPGQIEKVLEKVDGLLGTLEKIDYDPFEIHNKLEWKNTMEWFQSEVEQVEEEATR